MKKRRALQSLTALAAMSIMLGENNRPAGIFIEDKPTKPNHIPSGCKEFNIDGKIIYAINYKNALRKSRK